MEKSLTKDKGWLEVEVERIKTEVSKAKSLDVTKFKESKVYKSFLTSTIAMFFAIEKSKMERLL